MIVFVLLALLGFLCFWGQIYRMAGKRANESERKADIPVLAAASGIFIVSIIFLLKI